MKNETLTTQTAGASKGSWLLLAPLVLLVLGSIGVLAWWQYYKTTPVYSVALLIDAAKRNDIATLDKLVDTDQVVENFMAGLQERPGGGYSGEVLAAIRRRLQGVTPENSPGVKDRIREAVRRRINELGETAGNAPFVVMAVALYFNANISTSGDKATLVVSRPNQNLELGLTRTNDYWRVTSAKDDALAAQIIADTIKHVPKGLSPIELPNPLGGTLPRLPIP